MNLKDKIEQANKAYRLGNSVISDKEYDKLLEQYRKEVSSEEFEKFIKTLNEGVTEYGEKIKHPYVMGSLSKLKYECPDEVKKFIDKYCNSLNVSAKIDGISCRLHYENGKLISASTRGDGYEGTSLTDKIDFVKFVPEKLGTGKLAEEYKSIDIRGELVILKDDFANMTGFANARNAVAGIMNRKDWKQEDVSNVSFIAYTILGTQFNKEDQFALLAAWGFKTAWNETFRPYYFKDKHLDVVEELFKYASQDFEYDVDGLVICDAKYKNEDTYRPDACKAFKINQLVAETKIVDVVWEGPSKNGVFCPVAILEPIELGGAMISRCSLYNLDFIKNMKVAYGSRVKLMRSGDVIPKIVEVIDKLGDNGTTGIYWPKDCPCCGSRLDYSEVNPKCINMQCEDKLLHQTVDFIKRLGVKSASEATLKKFNIKNIPDLLTFKANPKYKSEVKLESELLAKVFSRSKQELLAAMPFEDLGETLINKIVDFYGYDIVANPDWPIHFSSRSGMPSGIAMRTMIKFISKRLENINYVNMFINDSRYNCLEVNMDNTGNIQKNGMSVCFTGKLNTMSRSKASKLAEDNGFEVRGGVNKGLTYLVTNDPNSGSSKNRKAKELGTKVITEDEFLKLCNENQVDLDNL